MAKIQNPENQRGEKLATEINVSESLKNLSEEIHSLEYIVSSITNETMPVTFGLDINVSTNLENVNLEGEEKQLTDAKAAKAYTNKALETAKAYTDEKVGEETTRATGREDSIEAALNAEIERATTRENAIETSLNDHAENIINHFKEGEHEQLFSDNERLFATTEEFSILEENINDINNELETYNYSLAQSIETGTTSDTNNTRGFATLIVDNITLGKVITYCHPTGGSENTNIWLKVFEKTTAPHIFKGISDTSLNHVHGSSLEYTFKNSDIKLEANKEYFFVFCPDSQKSSTTFSTSTDSADCCVKTVTNTTGHGGVLGSNGISRANIIALHKIYKKPGKFAFANDLEEHSTDDSIHLIPEEKTTVISLKSANINNLYDRADNVTTVSNNTITFSDGNTAELEPENIISAQYAFRATNTTSSQLTSFNQRTVYAHIDGTIETNTGVDNTSQSSVTQHCRYEQDLVDQDDEVTQSLSTLINGTGMFVRSKLTLFNDDLTCLTNGKSMFASNYELTEFKSPLPNLVYAKGMFTGCRKLTKWRVKLPSLVIGNNMFSSTANDPANYMQLAEVDTCLPNLTIARQMFYRCFNLTKFHVPSTSFSNLYDAQEMFQFTKITSINGNFESLENGERMFADGPTLDVKSVQNIAETIRDWSEGYPGMTDNNKPIISLGTLDTSDSDIIAALDKIKDKGWEVEPDIPEATALNSDTIGFFVRVSYNLSDKTHIDENGNQCSLVLVPTLQWITNKDVWSPMVSSIEEAETHFNLSKIETPEETI